MTRKCRAYANMAERLCANCEVDANGCWVWQPRPGVWGYAYVYLWEAGRRRTRLAHRVSYETFKGPIPEKLEIRHTCHNRPCINPDHLIVGTRKQNMLDRTLAGRKGSKITPADVRHIRADGRRPYAVIAADYGINASMVSHIKTRRYWPDVADEGTK